MNIRSYLQTGAVAVRVSGGAYLYVEQLSAGTVNIELFGPSGETIGNVQEVAAGFFVNLAAVGGSFGYAVVTPSGATTMNIIVSDFPVGVVT